MSLTFKNFAYFRGDKLPEGTSVHDLSTALRFYGFPDVTFEDTVDVIGFGLVKVGLSPNEDDRGNQVRSLEHFLRSSTAGVTEFSVQFEDGSQRHYQWGDRDGS